MRVQKQNQKNFGDRTYSRLVKIIGTPQFFWGVLLLFFIEAGWIALSSRFPQAYDEVTHFSIIVFYSHQWLPFIQHQPASTYGLGQLSRDPSYLYHYLMSFPYRLIRLFSTDQTTTILWLRFVNISIFLAAIATFRKVLQLTGASKALVNFSLLILVFLPLVPYLAAQINYDSFLFLFTGLSLWAVITLVNSIKRDNKLSVVALSSFVITASLGSLSKYSFLPILIVETGFVGFYLYKFIRKNSKVSWRRFAANWQTTRLALRIVLIIGVLLSAGLFMEQYGYNFAKYHSPNPDCSRVLSVDACLNYAPWKRNYLLGTVAHDPVSVLQVTRFSRAWVHITSDGVFSVFDASSGGRMEAPISVLVSVSGLVAVVGAVLLVYYRRDLIYGNVATQLFITVSIVYLAALIANNYIDYTHFGKPIAIQGRYLLPLLPLWIVMAGLAYAKALAGRAHMTLVIMLLVVFVFLQGGSDITYILRSNTTWYQESPIINNVNTSLRDLFTRSYLNQDFTQQ